jgi:serine/threonine protein phosphatase PrpC
MEYYILSRTGSREMNEDSAGVEENDRGFCCILADGLGGHDRGEVASSLVTETGLSMFRESCHEGDISLNQYLTQCFQESQKRLLERQLQADSEMKTTMVVLAAVDGNIQWGHIGDSRLYQFYRGKMVKRTLDHSVPQMLVMTGEIREKDIRGHEDRNRLLRVMGVRDKELRYELAELENLQEQQAYLLCSDGFWELIEEKQMMCALQSAATPKEWLETMEREILKNGAGKDMDNYTAIGVFIGEHQKRRKFFGIF